jgi:hypothetical protein
MDRGAFGDVQIHPDVNVMRQITSARDFEFLTFFIIVYASEYDLAIAHGLRIVLPRTRESPNVRVGLQAIDHRLRQVELGCSGQRIRGRRTYDPVQIGFLGRVIIIEDVVLKTHKSKLLDYMRSATAQSGDPERTTRHELLEFGTEKRLE